MSYTKKPQGKRRCKRTWNRNQPGTKKAAKKNRRVEDSTAGGSLYRDTDYSSDTDRFNGPRGDTW